MIYPIYAQELIKLLEQDQVEWRNFARLEFENIDALMITKKRLVMRQNVRNRANQMLTIIHKIGKPTLTNIGADAAQAVSILALHDSQKTLQTVLEIFMSCYVDDPGDTYAQAIPSMTDMLYILDKKPQKFGTIWLLDKNKQPFLPIVEDFEHVNERRAVYNIESLHWPKSLAIPESEQPWLNRPLLELTMRSPTQKEFSDFAKDFLDN